VNSTYGGRQTWRSYWSELWQYRELCYFLAWRDVLVRYKQTVLGVAWALLRPALTLVIFTLVFDRMAGLPSGGAPYPLMILAGMLPWQFFAGAFSEAGGSLVANSGMLSKVYFPRLLLPVSAAFSGVVDFAVSLSLMLVLMFWYGTIPSLRLVALIPFFALALVAAIGAGTWVAALNLRYRDFRYIVPFVVQLGFFVAPVGFQSALVSDRWRLLYSMNPIVGTIDGFRWALLGEGYPIYWPGLYMSIAVALLILLGGIRYFRGAERWFADFV